MSDDGYDSSGDYDQVALFHESEQISQEWREQEKREDEEEQRVDAAKAALKVKLIGYEGGFTPSAQGGQHSAAALVESVVSAEHVPVAKEKVQTARDAVVLLLNGQPVQGLQRDGLSYLPVELIDGAAADSFEVVMEAPTLLYRTNAEARARKEQQIIDTTKKIADADATLAELKQALTRSEAAFKEAVEAASDPDGQAELSDIGALAIEKQRIVKEITKQQSTLESQQSLLQQAQSLDVDSQLTEHRVTPRFPLQSGFNILPACAGRSAQVVHVLKQAQHTVKPVQFSHSVTDAK